MQVEPFLISIDKTTGLWSIVGHDHLREMSATRTMQESVVGKFAANWFTISNIESDNDAMWQTCEREACNTYDYKQENENMCALFCATSGEVFTKFVYNVVPDYVNRAAVGETWAMDMSTVVITPDGAVTESGGSWQISAQVVSSVTGPMDILAFATVARMQGAYPQTLGFYVKEFNAYRINK